jgi:hypothetical protein
LPEALAEFFNKQNIKLHSFYWLLFFSCCEAIDPASLFFIGFTYKNSRVLTGNHLAQLANVSLAGVACMNAAQLTGSGIDPATRL